eukprot:CAMPEP_0115479376 /NCGR_PEP_ID=MMETSP0271-20121206/56700_1 /TAXON_ID=71861 /ORGANISM="Scrippsiella trochoidea, Strain CCMP3099" /LENGTH=64 /DNA_ID=CAMNT_0002906977 /DNA_START=331 /DNA_END=525 /DNA_ORIENTATION=-
MSGGLAAFAASMPHRRKPHRDSAPDCQRLGYHVTVMLAGASEAILPVIGDLTGISPSVHGRGPP